MIGHEEALLRIAVGGAFGAIVGFERNRAGRPAGLRMHLIVALASATFMVLSAHFMFFQGYVAGHGPIEVDPSRIAASVVTGIGFLGGGTIMRTGMTVQGLTTAAGIWLVSAAGMCAGAGMFVEGTFVTATGALALALLRRFEHKDVVRQRVSLVLADARPERVDELLGRVATLGANVSELDYDRRFDIETGTLSFDVKLPGNVPIATLLAALEGHAGISHVSVRSPSRPELH
ncbi:MAG TPA: MgtC/SapB family protein [Planctomycetota bacterium]|nr:MgtC/SapB family protein [Planctomycetota bacterium]